MEFKGTKGKWTNSSNAVHNEEGKCICITYENIIVDALLISKAPEMFELLKDIYFGSDGNDINYWKDKIEQLIKQATEL